MARLLLFGGSFDPLHHGHLVIGRAVAERLNIPRVLLLPSAVPPHKQDQRLTPAAERLAMCRRGVAEDGLFAVDDFEAGRAGPNYTLHTVAHFRGLHPDDDLYWLIGQDSLLELGTWYRAAELVEACTVVTAARPGYAAPDAAALGLHFTPAQVQKLLQHVLPTPQIEIAGRDIRARVRAGLSIRYLVPEAVRAHIEERGLYRD